MKPKKKKNFKSHFFLLIISNSSSNVVTTVAVVFTVVLFDFGGLWKNVFNSISMFLFIIFFIAFHTRK